MLLFAFKVFWTSSCIHFRNLMQLSIHFCLPRSHPPILSLSLFELNLVSNLISIFPFPPTFSSIHIESVTITLFVKPC